MMQSLLPKHFTAQLSLSSLLLHSKQSPITTTIKQKPNQPINQTPHQKPAPQQLTKITSTEHLSLLTNK